MAQNPLPFPDYMIEGINGSILLQLLHRCLLVLVECLLQPPHENLELPELVEERLVSKEGYVLCIIVGLVSCAAFVHLLHVLGLMRIDSLQNAQPSAMFSACSDTTIRAMIGKSPPTIRSILFGPQTRKRLLAPGTCRVSYFAIVIAAILGGKIYYVLAMAAITIVIVPSMSSELCYHQVVCLVVL